MDKSKDKDRILKEAREKQQVTQRELPYSYDLIFSAETLQARREWYNIFKVMKGKKLQPRIFYLASLSFRFDGKVKSFTEKQKLKEFSTIKPAL